MSQQCANGLIVTFALDTSCGKAVPKVVEPVPMEVPKAYGSSQMKCSSSPWAQRKLKYREKFFQLRVLAKFSVKSGSGEPMQ